MKISSGTIARTVALFVALINELLVIFGRDALPFTQDGIYQAASTVFMAVTTVVAWWKNNSFTKPAIMADEMLKEEKAKMTDNAEKGSE